MKDEGRVEPVVDIPVIEHGLEGREAGSHQRDPKPVALAQQTKLGGALGQGRPEHGKHYRAGRQGDLKHPRPTVIIGQIAADRRRECRAYGKPGQSNRLFRARQHDHDDREGERDQHTAGEAVQRVKKIRSPKPRRNPCLFGPEGGFGGHPY